MKCKHLKAKRYQAKSISYKIDYSKEKPQKQEGHPKKKKNFQCFKLELHHHRPFQLEEVQRQWTPPSEPILGQPRPLPSLYQRPRSPDSQDPRPSRFNHIPSEKFETLEVPLK